MKTMSRLILLIALLLPALGLLGCSLSDKNQSSPTDPDTENLTDDEYEATSEALGMSREYMNEMLAEMLSGVGRIDAQSGSPSLSAAPGSVFGSTEADSVFMEYDPSTGYWRLYTYVEDNVGGMSLTYIDTLQFRTGGTFTQWPNETVTEIRCGIRLTAAPLANSENAPDQLSLDYGMAMSVAGELWTEGLVEVDADGSFTFDAAFSDSTSSCDFGFGVDLEIWDLQMDLSVLDAGSCPTGGTISSSGNLDWYCVSDDATLDVDGSWTAMETYSEDGVVVVMEADGQQYNYSGPCDGM